MVDVVLLVAGDDAEGAQLVADALADRGRASETIDRAPAVARGAVVAFGAAAEAAVLAAADTSSVAALVLVSAPLSADAIELLAAWDELPILAVADATDRPALRAAVDVYLGSAHGASDIAVGPVDGAAATVVAAWLDDRLTTGAVVEEVVLNTADGWELSGTRWLPGGRGDVPGVVLLHSGRSDRAVFTRLERLLADRGMAVLNLDWRGRGRSTGGGTYFSLTPEQRAEGWRDAAAAFDHLASCAGVDRSRLGAVGVIHGAEHAARAAQHDPRVKALTILTGYRPADEHEAAHLTSGAVDVLYVTSTDHLVTTEAMRGLYEATSSPRTRFVEYPGGAIGYQLFDLDPTLEPQIVAWLAEVLEVGR